MKFSTHSDDANESNDEGPTSEMSDESICCRTHFLWTVQQYIEPSAFRHTKPPSNHKQYFYLTTILHKAVRHYFLNMSNIYISDNLLLLNHKMLLYSLLFTQISSSFSLLIFWEPK